MQIKYISPETVCEIVPGMTKGALSQLRFMGKGPRYYKPTPKKVVYLEAEVLAWVEASVQSNSGTAA